MVETRSNSVASQQTSFFVLGALLLSLGAEIARTAKDSTGQVIGLGFAVTGGVIIYAKYKFKLPDISAEDVQAALQQYNDAYEGFIKALSATYGDVHKARDEILAHRQVIEAMASFLPQAYKDKLKPLLDALDHNYGVN